MERKKILFIITKSNLGGAQRYVLELATSLPKDRYDVVVAFGGSGLLKTRLEEAGIKTRTIQSFERDIHIGKEFVSMRELHTLIREERPHNVHLNSSKAGGIGALIARLCGVKNIVFTAHGWPFYEKRNVFAQCVIWFFSYLTTLCAHRVIVVSEHDRRGARMWGLTSKIIKIHTALPPIQFETQEDARAALFPTHIVDAHQNDLWLVSTGEHTHNKNLGVLIDALARLKERGHTGFFLTLMSDGELHGHLQSLVIVHGLENQVYFTGFVPEARTFLMAFDIFLMPSRKEGFPYGLLEAGATGLPVVASAVGGIPELVRDGETGLLINPERPDTIVEALTRLRDDHSLRLSLGHALKNKVEGTYTLARMVEETKAVYEKGSVTV
jgi:glycosyltransferase involved in cell wall biosynthesis